MCVLLRGSIIFERYMVVANSNNCSLGPKCRKSSFISLENPWKLVESHFITASNVKKCEKQY